jgi:hypothetical protein
MASGVGKRLRLTFQTKSGNSMERRNRLLRSGRKRYSMPHPRADLFE